jgi:glutamate synthase domain-containing protein 3
MTNGVVVVLGPTGRNFGAGMSGGRAYVLDAEATFTQRYNPEMVRIERVTDENDVHLLQGLIAQHARGTPSAYASYLLAHWSHYLGKFWKVAPQPGVAAAAAPTRAARPSL